MVELTARVGFDYSARNVVLLAKREDDDTNWLS